MPSVMFLLDGNSKCLDENLKDSGISSTIARNCESQKGKIIPPTRSEESQKQDGAIITKSSKPPIQRSQSENPPLFHDFSSGRLVKLENFSFDDTPNHFYPRSLDAKENINHTSNKGTFKVKLLNYFNRNKIYMLYVENN